MLLLQSLGVKMGQAPSAAGAFGQGLVLGSLEGAGTGMWGSVWGTNEVGGHAVVYWGHGRIYQGMMWYSGAF